MFKWLRRLFMSEQQKRMEAVKEELTKLVKTEQPIIDARKEEVKEFLRMKHDDFVRRMELRDQEMKQRMREEKSKC